MIDFIDCSMAILLIKVGAHLMWSQLRIHIGPYSSQSCPLYVPCMSIKSHGILVADRVQFQSKSVENGEGLIIFMLGIEKEFS